MCSSLSIHKEIYIYIYMYMLAPPQVHVSDLPADGWETCWSSTWQCEMWVVHNEAQDVHMFVEQNHKVNFRYEWMISKTQMWFFFRRCGKEGSSLRHRRRDNIKDDNLGQDIYCKGMKHFFALHGAASPSCCLYSGWHEPLDQLPRADPKVLAATPVLVLGWTKFHLQHTASHPAILVDVQPFF